MFSDCYELLTLCDTNAILFEDSLRLSLLFFVATPGRGHSLQFVMSCGSSHYPRCILTRANSGNQLSPPLHSCCCLPLPALPHWQIGMHHINLTSISIFPLIWWLSPHWTSLAFTVSLLHCCAPSPSWWQAWKREAAPGLQH